MLRALLSRVHVAAASAACLTAASLTVAAAPSDAAVTAPLDGPAVPSAVVPAGVPSASTLTTSDDLVCMQHRATGAPVVASSTYSSAYGAAKAVDGECSESSRWMSSAADAAPTLEIGLAAGTPIGTVTVLSGSGWPRPYADTVLVDFAVEARTEGGWVEVGQVAGNTSATVTFETEIDSATAVRLSITGKSRHSIDAARVYEVVVRAPGEGPPTLGPVAVEDAYTVTTGESLAVSSPGLLANDTLPDDVAPAVADFSSPSHGTVSVESDGSFVYAPEPGYVGVDVFTYAVGHGSERTTATVTVTVARAPGSDTVEELQLSVASGRADMVAGGDALLRVDVPPHVPLDAVTVTLNRSDDVTAAFRPHPTERALVGMVSGLAEGDNRVEAVAQARGRQRAEVAIVNHPQEGPVFSGPHQQPFTCETAQFRMPVVGGYLGEALDEHCTVEPRVDYFYRTTGGTYRPLPAGASAYPSDVAMTANSLGVAVPFIVRMATSSANRAVVQTTVLHDPIGEPAPSAVDRPAGWNGRTVFTLGGGCAGGWYRSGTGTGTVTDPFLLGRGFALVSSSLNVFGNNCNEVLAAETAMMAKEVFVESYGAPEHTIGYGCSGGSYQAHQIADNYPGIFDGIVVGCSFPEVGIGTVNFLSDARLLDTYFRDNATVPWTEAQKRDASGFATAAMISAMSRGANRIDPRRDCEMVGEDARYHPETNPTGTRCGVYDHAQNIYGTDRGTGFAHRPLDNVGIQYGLGALNEGRISAEQFLDLNERIGGLDVDANVVPSRTQAHPDAVRTAYRTGRVTHGGKGLAEIPIIDYRSYYDDVSWGDIHVRYHTFSLRERLREANGTTANHVSLVEDARYGLFSTDSPLVRHAVTQMDHWLTNLAGLPPSGKTIDRISASRPTTLLEGCNTRDAEPTFVAERIERDAGSRCEQLYPTASFPREVAGEDVTADVIVCERTRPRREDYAVEWSDEQWERLLRVFDGGVCDYTRPGKWQQATAGTWRVF